MYFHRVVALRNNSFVPVEGPFHSFNYTCLVSEDTTHDVDTDYECLSQYNGIYVPEHVSRSLRCVVRTRERNTVGVYGVFLYTIVHMTVSNFRASATRAFF